MPYILKEFGSATIPAGGKVELTFTLVNDTEDELIGVSFEDELPIGMTIASPNGLVNPNNLDGIEADEGAGIISVTDAVLGSGEIVTFTVVVVAANAGVYENETSLLTVDEEEIEDSQAFASITALRSSDDTQWLLMRFDAKTREEEEA